MASMMAAAFVCTQAIFWDEQLNWVAEFATAVMLPRLEVWMVTADEVTLVTRPITSSRCENWPAARSVCVDAGGSVVAVNALVAPRLTAVTVCPVNVFDRMELPGEQEKMEKGVSNDSGKAPLANWKADPAREQDCIFCRACEIQCPVQAIKITEP